MRNWDPEWLQVVVAFLALLAAGAAYVVSRRSYWNSFRPLLRPVILGTPPALDRLALKNLGRGPALAIVILRDRGERPDLLAGEVDALEQLGPTHGPQFNETSRVGRTVARITPPLELGNRYRILYQDFEGEWHETALEVVQLPWGHFGFRVRYLKQQKRENVPEWVRERAHIVTESI